MEFQTLFWKNNQLHLIDQTQLPNEEIYLPFDTSEKVAQAIRDMIVRGAPAIGVTAAYGIALACREIHERDRDSFFQQLQIKCENLAQTRPTAVNLFWAIQRMTQHLENFWNASQPRNGDEIQKEALDEATRIHQEDISSNEAMGEYGATLVPNQSRILTHCNAGALATAGFGTALGVIYAAHRLGKVERVYADETRPFLQGSRLTAWELQKNQVPTTLICDNMAGSLMKQGKIDMVIVGADRIAANGDVANKIGTYSVAVLAKEHQIPFYVAAPRSTIDFSLNDGDQIPIEERHGDEIRQIKDHWIAPQSIEVYNPAFDVTPNKWVKAIITEKGIAKSPYIRTLQELRD